MGSLRLSATPGTSLSLLPVDQGISICLESSGENSCSTLDLVVTNTGGGLRLEIVPSSLSSGDDALSVQNSTSAALECSTAGLLSPFDLLGMDPFQTNPGMNDSVESFPMDWDSVSFNSPASSSSMPFEEINILPHSFCSTENSQQLGNEYSIPTPVECSKTLEEPTISLSGIASEITPPPSPPSGPRPSTTIGTLPCRFPDCEKFFKREHTRMKHEASHAAIYCAFPGCGTRFKRNHDRMRHEYLRHGKADNLCKGCNKTFLSSQNLKKHRCALLFR